MGLKPLEFSEALLDSPYFRENIHEHERELDRTNDAIKSLIRECKSLIKAQEQLSKAQRNFANVLKEFRLECIGEIDTDDEMEIARAFETFSQLFDQIDDERKRVVENATSQLIDPLERFRKDQIGEAREEKRKFDRSTEKYCNCLQNFLATSSKKSSITNLEESLIAERDNFYEIALSYVFKLQEVNEKKKFEFVETLLGFVYGQMTFFHSGHEVFEDHKNTLVDLQVRLQNTRDRFEITKVQAASLQERTRKKAQAGELQSSKMYARQGYLMVQKKGKGGLGYTWNKNFCMYTKENKIFTMVPYVQTQSKMSGSTDTVVLKSCVRRMTESIDKRFCFDITAQDRPQPITLQAQSEDDRKQWLCAMDGKEPIYLDSNELAASSNNEDKASFDDFLIGVKFLKKCVAAIETRGINEQGLYRVVGVGSKVKKLLDVCFVHQQIDELELDSDECEYEVKTITSAVKHFLRSMTAPLLTFEHHDSILEAAKTESYDNRVEALKAQLDKLPYDNYEMLDIITEHLKKVAENSKRNLMQASNLGVVFGPTLMRSREETMAAIMNLKYQTIVVELMINEYDALFDSSNPFSSSASDEKPKPSNAKKPDIPDKKPETSEKKPELPNKKPELPGRKPVLDDKNVYSVPPTVPPPRSCPAARTQLKSYPAPLPPQSRAKNLSLTRKQKQSSSSDENVAAQSESNVMSKLKAFESTDGRKNNGGISTVSSQYATTGPTTATTDTRARQNSPPPLPTSPPPRDVYQAPPPRTMRRVRTKFPCVGENTTELSFDADVIITNVRDSKEPGWLEGTLNGKTGLIPSNYVEFI
ncbi:rho GTPase-activating protein 26-like [Dendronephthya gigantea]|uniref:rho GTPase-activating protein 26-like n=1 Tax=Dendronephthya gigantea TaxID=151771 RepID=UPI0010699EC9|nr:rho GTPase-activating protein 26-like [Dendronephthya gigantea]